jgi:hypothetical protein
LANQRFYVLALCSLTLWACSLAPIGKLAKGVCLILGLYCATETMHHSQRLINEQALAGATEAMVQELQRVELALATHAQEEELKQQYAPEATYPPEVRHELNESLKHLYQEPSAPAALDTSASTPADRNRKAFYLSIKSLLEVHPPTYIIEEILGYQGRKFNEGKAILEALMQEGMSKGW